MAGVGKLMGTMAVGAGVSSSLWKTWLRHIPAGSKLPYPSWAVRHRAIQVILALHIPALGSYALLTGVSVAHTLLEVFPIAVALACSALFWLPRRFRAISASVGLIVCSAVLVHLSGGYIEMHFHFFVMVIIISMYEDWLPLLFAIAFVVLHHGGLGVMQSDAVYKNPDAVAHPWRWAAIHGAFVLAASAASVVSWRLNERARSKAETVLHSVEDGICGVDAEGRVTFANRAAEAMFQRPSEALIGHELHALVHPSVNHQGGPCPLLTPASGPGARPFEAQLARPKASILPVDCSFTPLAERDGNGGVIVLRDISQRKHYEERLAHQAMYDDLSGLPNRRLFGDRLSHALAGALVRGQSVAVIYADVDRFKLVNDTLGHQAGDTLLIALAREFRACVRASDTVARLGGDEFAILIEGLEEPGVPGRIAEKLLANLRQPIPIDGRPIAVSVSLGIALSSPERVYVLPDDLLRDADIAMYEAKSAGGSQAIEFAPWMSEQQVHRLELESDLRHAVERGELRLEYQPEVSLETGTMVGVEALVRWDHPTLGTLSPLQFIPIAEESGRIVEIGNWVISAACGQLRDWQATYPGAKSLVMSINLSLLQLRNPGIVELVRSEIERCGLRPDSLKFELTETEMMHDTETTIAVLHQLEGLGVRLAIDDFGTGYSSLSYLQQFPVRTLKIDRSFLASLDSQGTLSILRAIMALAKALNVDVTAEGIETEEHRRAMTALGCDRGQGFLFARPLSPADLADALRGFEPEGLAA